MWRLQLKRSYFIVFLILVAVIGISVSCTAEPKASLSTGLEISAESAVLMDSNGNILYEKDPYKPLPPASVTKVMTLLLGVEAVEQGKIQLSDSVYTSENAWHQGGSQIWLEPGEAMTVKEMLTAIAVVSANDAAAALMEHVFGSTQAAVDAMNRRAQELGLKNSHFSNVNGLPTSDHYMSAYDTATIAREAIRHPLYMDLVSIKEYWLRNGKNWLVNTNKLLWWYKGADGLKTGWTEEAKYCFVGTAKRDNLRLIAVVFACPEPRSHLRESMKLLDWGYANFSAVPVVEKGVVVDRVKVTKGKEREVQLIAADELNLVIAKNQNKNLTKNVVIDNNIYAPVAAGQKCGELVVAKDGKEVGKVDLVAEKSVDKAGFLQVMESVLGSLFSITR
ncbi:MAG: dacF [Firmicutes bacterium]|nr:dacF [Bacillota bacterium]